MINFTKIELKIIDGFIVLLSGIIGAWFCMEKYFVTGILICIIGILIVIINNLYRRHKNTKGIKNNIEPVKYKQESKYISGKELMTHWNMEGFEFFNCLKKGLQPYTWHGKKIIDTDTLEHARNNSLEYYIGLVRGTEETGNVVYPGSSSYRPLTDPQIVQKGKELYESQPLKPIDPPPHHMSYTLPNNNKKAAVAIKGMMELKFRKDEASKFAKKYGYKIITIKN